MCQMFLNKLYITFFQNNIKKVEVQLVYYQTDFFFNLPDKQIFQIKKGMFSKYSEMHEKLEKNPDRIDQIFWLLFTFTYIHTQHFLLNVELYPNSLLRGLMM